MEIGFALPLLVRQITRHCVANNYFYNTFNQLTTVYMLRQVATRLFNTLTLKIVAILMSIRFDPVSMLDTVQTLILCLDLIATMLFFCTRSISERVKKKKRKKQKREEEKTNDKSLVIEFL